jgi:hypothetical protein
MMSVWLFKFLRGLVNALYVVVLEFAAAWTIDGRGMPFPLATSHSQRFPVS